MTIGKLFRYFGIALIIYALISGFHFHFSSDQYGSSFDSSHSIKLGTMIIGVILIYLGKRLSN